MTYVGHRLTTSLYVTDMSVQNCIGDSFRGATWVALHNGGGVGWGEVVNGGFGLVLDGSPEAESRAKSMLKWDVSNGVSAGLIAEVHERLEVSLIAILDRHEVGYFINISK